MGEDAPCRNCDFRIVGCHDNCDSYQEWKHRHEEFVSTMRRMKGYEIDYVEFRKHRGKRK